MHSFSLSSLHCSLNSIYEGLVVLTQDGTKATFESIISHIISLSTENGFNKNLGTQWDQMYCVLYLLVTCDNRQWLCTLPTFEEVGQ